MRHNERGKLINWLKQEKIIHEKFEYCQIYLNVLIFYMAAVGTVKYNVKNYIFRDRIRIRILPVTTEIYNYFHLVHNINQNQQILEPFCITLWFMKSNAYLKYKYYSIYIITNNTFTIFRDRIRILSDPHPLIVYI